MDLCLACKGECPNSVDMKRLKAEVLYQQGHSRRMRNRFFALHYWLTGLAFGPRIRLKRIGVPDIFLHELGSQS